MYNFNQAEEKEVKPIFPLGESVENVTIQSVDYVTGSSEKGDYEVIDIVLKAPNGGELRDRIFPVNPQYVSVRSWIPGDTKEQALQDAYNRLMTRLLHYATKLGLTKEILINYWNEKLQGKNDFKSMAKLYAALMRKAMKDNPEVHLYVKSILDKNGYVKLPSYSSGFLQRMDEGASKLSYTDRELSDNAARSKTPSGGSVDTGDFDIEDDEPDLDDLDLD